MPDWALAIILALVSAGAGLGAAWLGNQVTKRFGLPTNIEARLVRELQELNQALEANNERLEAEVENRKAAEATCISRLEEAELRESAILRRLDDVEAQNARLLQRLDA